jgi:hypothetical protein
MRFARVVFLLAGIYGLIVIAPQYFLETNTGHDFPPPINHPEFYYGFLGVTLAWQVLFLMLSRDPLRYRPLMIPCVLEKAGFPIAIAVLYLQHRVSGVMLGAAFIDVILGVLLIAAYLKTKPIQTES